MKPDLLRKATAKLDAIYLKMLGIFLQGNRELGDKQKAEIFRYFWKNSPQRKQFEGLLRKATDEDFAVVMTNLDSLPLMLHKLIKENLAFLPKSRGGRPSEFSIDIRRRAVQDLGAEYARCDTFKQAVDLVASRYGMPPEYLRRVWKNRKRLKPI